MAALVEDILLLSRIESERLAKAPEQIMVKQDIASWVADERVELDIDENLVLESDRKALGYIVSNLVENALKYAPDSKVIVRATTRNDKFLLEVFDEGPGIDHAFRKRIFERFYRPPESTREGTGLGLSIVKNLTQSLGGQCGVKDNTPKGSVFWVEL